MNKWAMGLGGIALVAAAFWAVKNAGSSAADIEYRYAPVTKGDLARSTSSTGVLVPLTKVDVKSKAGGKVMRLLVEEGSIVRQGQTIALIDPEDTNAAYQQAEADAQTARSRVSQANTNAAMESRSAVDRVRDAEIALTLARVRLDKARATARSQPALSKSDLRSAEANLETAKEALWTTENVTVLQTRKDAQGQFAKACAELDAADSELTRLRRLLEQGYVSQSAVERQVSVLAAARAAHRVAEQRNSTVEGEIASDLKAARARVRQAEQTLEQAKANQIRIPITAKDVEEALANVRASEVALRQARTAQLNTRLRQAEITAAKAGSVRSSVAVRNARVQLDSTTVVAPRDGIVTLKYLEEGTIIPPGTSTFAQGTSLVQIADTTTMYVECSVDEADIGSVRIGQDVSIIVEAYPGQPFDGEVKKVFPAAETANALTTVKVRVQVTGYPKGEKKGPALALRPGMNATCEFIQESKNGVLVVPSQSVQHDKGKAVVRVKGADPKKPESREVQVGMSGNEGTEILSGLKEGEEVVIAEIDLRAMRDRQAKMDQAQQGGGFGSTNRGGPSQSRATSGGSTGGTAGRGSTGGGR